MKTLENVMYAARLFGATVLVADDVIADMQLSDDPEVPPRLVLKAKPPVQTCAASCSANRNNESNRISCGPQVEHR